jgi:hypothetical protein
MRCAPTVKVGILLVFAHSSFRQMNWLNTSGPVGVFFGLQGDIQTRPRAFGCLGGTGFVGTAAVEGDVMTRSDPAHTSSEMGTIGLLTRAINGDTVVYNGGKLPVKRVEVVFDADHFENSPQYKAAKQVAGTGKTVTLHGAFEWHRRFERLYF